MLGIVWGVVVVALLVAYGVSFREVIMGAFDAFGRSVVICWPGQTSQQAGGERAAGRCIFEQADVDAVLNEVPLIKHACLETVRTMPITYQERLANTAVRGVPRVWRDAQRGSQRRPVDLAGGHDRAAAWPFSSMTYGGNSSAAGPLSERRSRSKVYGSP
jgi:putative ABC transport system permease protein